MSTLTRRKFLKYAGLTGFTVAVGPTFLSACNRAGPAATSGPIKLGALIPLTGIETIFGQSMLDSTKVAVDEINAAGGINGRQIELIVEDEESNPERAVTKANKLIQETRVDVIIGTLLSSVRAAVLNVTQGKMLFLNPTYYEGGLCDKYYFSTGSVPNQQFDAFGPWLMENVGPKFYLVGSDYAWPRGSFEQLKKTLQGIGAEVVGEEYFPLGTTEFSAVIGRISAAAPDVLFTLVAGTDGVSFVKQVFDFGLKENMRIASSGFTELAGAGLSPEAREGILSYSDYFMSIDTPENKSFLEKYRALAGEDALVDLFGVNMYNNVHLYAEAVKKAGTTEKDAVAQALTEVSFTGPSGPIKFTPQNHHAIMNTFIAECDRDNNWQIVSAIEQVPAEQPGCSLQ